MKFHSAYYILIFSMLFAACKKDPGYSAETPQPGADQLLHLNQIQVIASHNSYRQMTTDTVYSFLLTLGSLIPPQYDPATLDYFHLNFEDQMNQYPVRGLEIDVYNDPQGGAFADRKVNSYVGLPTASGIPELNLPGFKVLHIKDVDYNTHYLTFKSALSAIKNWSQSHPGHLPLFINIETKIDSPADDASLASLGFLPPPPYDAAAADALDIEIRDIFGTNLNGIFTPDMLKGSATSLEVAATGGNWPLLRDCRGKIIFIMEGPCVPYYVQGHPSLQGRAMFTYSTPGNPEAAFILMNNARADSASIRNYVQLGYIVRTRCDEGTTEARIGDYSGMNAAFSSGAHICSTDYYKSDSRAGQQGWTDYHVSFPNAALGRKNPVSGSGIDVETDLHE